MVLRDSVTRRKRWILALCVSGLAGPGVGLTGLIISGLSSFGFVEKSKVLSLMGTLLIGAFFPLIGFSAHAMDKIAEIDGQKKHKGFDAKKTARSTWMNNDLRSVREMDSSPTGKYGRAG